VVVGDDDLEAERTCVLHLGNARDAAVDRQHDVEALFGETGQRLAVQAVALLEARRQMPRDVGAELAQEQHRQRRCADPVGVVVAVHADPSPGLDRGGQDIDRLAHVAERERVVAGQRSCQENPGRFRLGVAATDEDRSRYLVDLEGTRKLAHLGERTRCKLPVSGKH
jgi:hypothetical protein